jgi:hypothetical protein
VFDDDDPPDHDVFDPPEILIKCPFCDGTGETTTAFDINGRISFDCPECGGTGWS